MIKKEDRIRKLVSSAEEGSRSAQKECARTFWCGDVVPKNQGEAIRWYRVLAESGDAEDLMSLGLALVWSDEPMQNVEEGFAWITRAAEKGHSSAQYFLGSSYASADQVDIDLPKAIHWYKVAASNGHGEAQYNLAIMLLTGEGIEKDFESGLRWMSISAKAGNDFSIEFLRDAYRDGTFGFTADAEKFKYWSNRMQ